MVSVEKPSPPKPRPAEEGPFLTKIVVFITLAALASLVISLEWIIEECQQHSEGHLHDVGKVKCENHKNSSVGLNRGSDFLFR